MPYFIYFELVKEPYFLLIQTKVNVMDILISFGVATLAIKMV
jgi:hypothetical protein